MRSTVSAVRADEGGSAAVEFVLVSVLLVALFLGVLQVAFTVHERNVLAAAAADGARYGANADRTPEDGAAYTRALITRSLGARYARDVTASLDDADGAPVVVIRVHAPLPLIAGLVPVTAITVRGHALAESP